VDYFDILAFLDMLPIYYVEIQVRYLSYENIFGYKFHATFMVKLYHLYPVPAVSGFLLFDEQLPQNHMGFKNSYGENFFLEVK